MGKNISIKSVTGYIISFIVNTSPIWFLCFSVFMAWFLGGISQKALGLDDFSAGINKSIASLSMLCLFTSGFLRAKYKLDGLIDKSEATNLYFMYGFTVITLFWTLYCFSVSCGWLVNLKIGKTVINITPVSQYVLVGFNKQVVIFALVAIPLIEFISGLMALPYIVEVYPELKGKAGGSNNSSNPQDMYDEVKNQFSIFENEFNTLKGTSGLTKSDAPRFTSIKSELDKLKNQLITIKSLPNITGTLKNDCNTYSRTVANLISSIDVEVSKLP
jgi:hypothetical protein